MLRLEARFSPTVGETDDEAQMPLDRWFLSLSHCIDALRFGQCRLVIDLAGKEWRSWLDLLPDLRRLIGPEDTDRHLTCLLLRSASSSFDGAGWLDKTSLRMCMSFIGASAATAAIRSMRCWHRAECFGIKADELDALVPAGDPARSYREGSNAARLARLLAGDPPEVPCQESHHTGDAMSD